MPTITVTEAKARLYNLLNEVVITHEPVLITGKGANAVLLSEDDWRAVEEMLFLLSVTGMRESIVEGLNTPVAQCIDSDKVEW